MNYSTWDLRVKRKRFNSESGAKPATGLGSESPLGWGGCAESTPDGKPSFQQDTVMGGAAYAPWWSHSHLISRPTQALTGLHAVAVRYLFSTHPLGWSCFVITETRFITSLRITQQCFDFLLKDGTPHLNPPRRQWFQSHGVLSWRSPSEKQRPSAEWATLQ